MKPQVVFVLGGPGAGKGTQCARITQHFNYTHLSAGELLRKERLQPHSEYGDVIDRFFKQGKFVPVEVTLKLLKKEMESIMTTDKSRRYFLIDGFPPDEENLQGWKKVMDGEADVKFVLYLDCSNEVCCRRCLERGMSSGRDDDNMESLKRRLQLYLQVTRPVIEQYEQQGQVRTVDASRSIDEVFADVRKVFESET